MFATLTMLIILLIVVAVVITVLVIYFKIKNKIRNFSTEVFGTADIVKGLKNIEMEADSTPISLSGGDSIYLPMIMKDFNDYHRDIMEKKVKDFLFQYYSGISSKEMDVAENVKRNLDSDYSSNLRGIGYKDILVHDAAISGYEKGQEQATVHYQASAQYIKNNKKVQTKFSVNLVYMFKDTGFEGVALRCSYCNAPLENATATCSYCNAAVVRNIEKVWKINEYKKLI